MRKSALGLVLATFAGAAAAGDLSEQRAYGANDYSAQVYYRVDFGSQGEAQSLGLRFDNERATAHGAPAMFQASFGEQGLQKLAVTGVDFRGAMLSSNAVGGGFWSSLTGPQWIALAFTGLVFTTVAVDASDDEDPQVPGSGGS